MRRILFIVTLLIASNSLFTQKDVTKFMGIPIDGFKPEMIQKLKEKGFVSSSISKDVLEGELNGTQVNVYIATNNNKVWRIMLCDTNQMSETDIKIRFNKLCQQFQNSPNYLCFSNYAIADDEDIAYEITVHDKKYDALFYQKPLAIDSIKIVDRLKTRILKKYTQKELDKPTEEIEKDIYKMAAECVIELSELYSGKPV